MLDQIRAARTRLEPYLSPTPLIEAGELSRRLGQPVGLKLETLQPAGAFKVRPAFNGILARLEQARGHGVVTSSSGNFAQAVAYAAKTLGASAVVVMMSTASAYKRARTEALGARVEVCGDTFESRWETMRRIQQESGRLPLHPYDSEETIAGDGVIGLELIAQWPREACVLVPISGGGLISGIASAVKALRPSWRVVGVQPELNPSMRRSLDEGRRVTVTPGRSLADALTVAAPGEQTFEIVRKLVDDVVLVTEDEIAEAVRFLALEEKLTVEPGGAVGVAALLSGKAPTASLPPVCVLSGGNITPATLADILRAA